MSNADVFPDAISATTAVNKSTAPDGMRLFLGIDPGIHGGLAVIAMEDGAAPRLVEAIDVPVVGTGAKERVDVAAIRNFIDWHKPIRVIALYGARTGPERRWRARSCAST